MTDENRNGTIVGELSGLSEAELAAVQELLERTAEEAAVDDDDQSSSCWGGRLTLTYKPSMTRRRNTVPDCRVALPITETRPPKIADRIFANAMISLSSEHRALWRQAERELKNTPDGRATSQLRNRRFSMPNVPLNVEAEKKSGKKVSRSKHTVSGFRHFSASTPSNTSSLAAVSGKSDPSNFSQLASQRRRGRRRRLRREELNSAVEAESSSMMNQKQFNSWLDNLFLNAERNRQDEMRLMERRDPILSQYDPETMPLDANSGHHQQRHHHRGAFFESADDAANADYDDAELGWD
ncbi:hypothetical protein Pmar_PMAR026241 [Perkinsus marinus ATCC 50983]|uniref:Uncharacterized protein n=1 Tax=Perkinsus marinus (strain ATCC 50983 / TXsc) TaxID=423536 RepID=C5LI31_PERM5|nr:hypothetical protein Pmar_PMAR026241 [Perkinsus marinus ATCC 50983]EER03566.1 hypothetical protein Pmar_PMAR026241 [Perkinsus marinus ATCC 50983]|eukprot:XP_002771750.1 hypothetical protein Pmar_PMAR026241 [Perkinsus marinus ATCC 50983]